MIYPSTIQYFRHCPNYLGIRGYVAARWNVVAAGQSEGHGHCRLSCTPEPKSRLLPGPGEEMEGKSFLHAPRQMRGGWRGSNQINSTGVALFVNGVYIFYFFFWECLDLGRFWLRPEETRPHGYSSRSSAV